jgi:hypothetical protein
MPISVKMCESGVEVYFGNTSTVYTRPEHLQALIEELEKCKSLLIEEIEKKALGHELSEIWED